MKRKPTKEWKILRTDYEIAEALGITDPVDIEMMIYKADLSSMAVKVIAESGLSVNEIVEKSGVARSKVSFIKNGGVSGISIELYLKVIMGCGKKITTKAA